MSRDWYPLLTRIRFLPPEPGQLIGYSHGVWRVETVRPAKPAPNGPYTVRVIHIGGVKPPALGDADEALIDLPAESYGAWYVYSGARWPRCSCCGEPMPCRAELQDQVVAAGAARVQALESVLPGCCWACTEAVSHRQDSVTYDGPNLLLPGGAAATFHTRQACRYDAEKYERKWLAADPRRERILTWSDCGGMLIVHGDGSSECVSSATPLGGHAQHQAGCDGHLTHDHTSHTACYVAGGWFAPEGAFPGCPRGCDPDTHPGTRTSPRPVRRDRGPSSKPPR